MAIAKTLFDSMADFVSWAESTLVPEYFGAVSYDTSTGTLTGYLDAEKTDPVWSYVSNNTPKMTAYKSASSSRTITGRALASAGFPESAWTCANGVIIYNDSRLMQAIITKNNSGKAMSVIGGGGNSPNYLYTNVYCTAWGDDPSITTGLSFTPIAGNQTSLVQFCTDAPVGSVSYAPNAFYMPYGQYYGAGLGKFTSDGKTYLTNGYWAILDA